MSGLHLESLEREELLKKTWKTGNAIFENPPQVARKASDPPAPPPCQSWFRAGGAGLRVAARAAAEVVGAYAVTPVRAGAALVHAGSTGRARYAGVAGAVQEVARRARLAHRGPTDRAACTGHGHAVCAHTRIPHA